MLVRGFALLYAVSLLALCANLELLRPYVDPTVVMVMVVTQIPVILSLYWLDLKISALEEAVHGDGGSYAGSYKGAPHLSSSDYTPLSATKTLPRQRGRTPLPPRSKTPTETPAAAESAAPVIHPPPKKLSDRTQQLVRRLRHERKPEVRTGGEEMSVEERLVFDKYIQLPPPAMQKEAEKAGTN